VVNTLEKPSLPRRQLAANLPIFQKPYDRKPLGGKILTREIMYDCSNGRSFRIQKSALDAIQEATEAVIVNELGCKLLWFIVIIILIKIVANLAAIHAKRITIQVKDMLLVRAMRKGMTGHRYPGGGRITEPEN
jgi:histone H3/H4